MIAPCLGRVTHDGVAWQAWFTMGGAEEVGVSL